MALCPSASGKLTHHPYHPKGGRFILVHGFQDFGLRLNGFGAPGHELDDVHCMTEQPSSPCDTQEAERSQGQDSSFYSTSP